MHAGVYPALVLGSRKSSCPYALYSRIIWGAAKIKLFVMSFPTLLRNVICPLGIKNIKLFKNIKSKMYTLVPFYN